MRHPPCVLCEGLDTCRFLDCQEAIPEGHTLCWHCEAVLAKDFAPDGPDDVFYRTPEPRWRVTRCCAPPPWARGSRRERTNLPGASCRRSHFFLTKNTLLSISVPSINPTQFLIHFLPLLVSLAPLARDLFDNHLIFDRTPRLRQSSNRAPGGTTKTRLPAMTALLMLGRDVRGA